jgi:hypothetical protein
LSSTGRCTPWSQARGNLFILRKLNYHTWHAHILSIWLPRVAIPPLAENHTLFSCTVSTPFLSKTRVATRVMLLVGSPILIKKTKFSWYTRKTHIHFILITMCRLLSRHSHETALCCPLLFPCRFFQRPMFQHVSVLLVSSLSWSMFIWKKWSDLFGLRV